MEFLEKLQRKPEHVRRKIALLIAGGITLCILLLWFLSFSAGKPVLVRPPGETEELRSAMGSMFGVLKETVRDIRERITEVQSIYPEETPPDPSDIVAN